MWTTSWIIGRGHYKGNWGKVLNFATCPLREIASLCPHAHCEETASPHMQYTHVNNINAANDKQYTYINNINAANDMQYTHINNINAANDMQYTHINNINAANDMQYTHINNINASYVLQLINWKNQLINKSDFRPWNNWKCQQCFTPNIPESTCDHRLIYNGLCKARRSIHSRPGCRQSGVPLILFYLQ